LLGSARRISEGTTAVGIWQLGEGIPPQKWSAFPFELNTHCILNTCVLDRDAADDNAFAWLENTISIFILKVEINQLQVVASIVSGPVSIRISHDDLNPAIGTCCATKKHVLNWIAMMTPRPIIAFHTRLSPVDRDRFASRARTRALVTATSPTSNGFIRCFVVCLRQPGDSSLYPGTLAHLRSNIAHHCSAQ
jgi:hypothetical protein